MSDDEYQAQYDYDDYDNGEQEIEVDPETILEDSYYQANQFLKKDNFAQASQYFRKIYDDAKTLGSKTYELKSLCGLFLIECKQNSSNIIQQLTNILGIIGGVSKKEKQEIYKLITEDICFLTNKDLYNTSKNIIFQNLTKSQQSVKIKGLLRLGQLYNQDKDSEFFNKLLTELKTQIQNSDNKNERIIENKLQMFCLQIQYLQSQNNRKDTRIQQIAREASQMRTQITDSRISAIIKQNIGKMLVHEGNYQKASFELMEAFKQYVRIGDPNAKTILKHAVLVGIIAKQQINPFVHQQSKIYADDQDMQAIQNIRRAFEQKDMKLFNKNITSPSIQSDDFIESLIQQLKQVVTIEKLKVMTKPYNKITFSYLGLILGTTSANIERYLFKLITEGDLQGRIDTKSGFYEKKKEVDNLLKGEQQLIDILLSSLPRYHNF